MAKWPGIGERIRARLLALGYEKHGRADISAFSLQHQLLPSNVYRWVNADVLPERENLLRLATLLEVNPAWLLFGEAPEPTPPGKHRRRPVPISGGSAGVHPPWVGQLPEKMSLIRHAAEGWLAAALHPSWTLA